MAENSANVFSLQASISIDTTNFEKKIEKIKKSGMELQQTMEKGIKSVKALQQFMNSFDTKKFQQGVKGISEGFDGIGKSSEEGKEKIEDVGDSAEDTVKKSKTAFGMLKESTKKTFSEMAEQFKMTDDSLQTSISQTAASFSKITAAVQTVIGAIEKVGEVAAKSFKVAVKAGEEFSKGIVNIVDKANDIENTISLAFGGAGAAIGTYAFATGKDFEDSMAKVMGTLGIDKDFVDEKGVNQYEMLKKAAEEAGATTIYTAKDSADALLFLTQSGYDAYKSIASLPEVLTIAQAGGMDLAYTAQQISSSMNILGDTTTLEHFGDMLVAIANNSSTSVQEALEAFTVVAGQAKAAEVPIEQTLEFLGVLANANLRGSQGGTIARNLINNLYAPTDKARQLMEEKYGLYKVDTKGKLKDIRTFLSEVVDVVNALEDSDKFEFYSEIFDVRNISGATAAITDTAAWEKLGNVLEDCSGSAEQMKETMGNTLVGDIKSATSRLEAVGLDIYDYIVTPMRGAVQEVSSYLTELDTIIDEHGLSVGAFRIGDMVDESFQKNTPSITGFMDEAELIIRRFFQGFSNNIPNISENISTIIQKYGETRDKIFNAIADTFGKPENSKSIVNIGATILDTMLTTAENVTSQLADKLPIFLIQIVNSLSENKDKWTKSITAIIKNISDLVSKAAPELVEIGGTLLVAIVEGMATTTTEITKILPNITDALSKLFSNKEFSENLKSSFRQIIGDIGDIIVMLVDFLAKPENIDFTTDLLGNILESITSTLLEIRKLIEPKLKLLGEEIGEFLRENLTPFLLVVTAVGYEIGNAFVKGIAKGIFSPLTKIFGGGKNYVEQLGEPDYSVYGSSLVGPSQDIIGFSGPKQFNPTDETQLYPQLIEKTNLPAQIGANNGGFMQGLNTSIASLVSQMDFSWATKIGENIVTNIGSGISSLFENAKTWGGDLVSNFCSGVKEWFTKEGGLKDTMKDFNEMLNPFKNPKAGQLFLDDEPKTEETENYSEKIAGIVSKNSDIASLVKQSKSWGADMAQNFANGMNSNLDEVEKSAKNIAEVVYAYNHNTTPEKGPMKDNDVWGKHFVQNFIDGMASQKSNLTKTVEDTAYILSDLHSMPDKNITTSIDVLTQDFKLPDIPKNIDIPFTTTGFEMPEIPKGINVPFVSDFNAQNIKDGIKENKNSILDEIKSIISSIKDIFSKPISTNLGLNTQNFKLPDIPKSVDIPFTSNANQIFSGVSKTVDDTKSRFDSITMPQPPYKIGYTENPNTLTAQTAPSVTIQNVNINVEDAKISSDYDVRELGNLLSDEFVEKISEKIKEQDIFGIRARGAVVW